MSFDFISLTPGIQGGWNADMMAGAGAAVLDYEAILGM